MDYYRRILQALEEYFVESNWKKLFLEGGCFWLADRLHRGIRDSWFMINRQKEHCALYFEGGLYDVTGKISSKNFYWARGRDICFMRKHYVPGFDVEKLEQYLDIVMV